MPLYSLAPHAFFQEASGHAVFLDLKRDKYTALDPSHLVALRPFVRGWRSDSAAAAQSAAAGATTQIIDMLLREGVLTSDESVGKDAVPISIEKVTSTIDDLLGPFPAISRRDFKNFIYAWAITTLMIRFLPLSYLVNRVSSRRSRQPCSSAFDFQKAHRLMTAYFILRPNFFSEKGACLRDSLTFIEYFALYNLFPLWVFGVKMEPFCAHSWVQQGPMVLNDYIPELRHFAPILAA